MLESLEQLAQCSVLLCFAGPGFSTERAEQYATDPSRSATLDMPGRKKGRVPYAAGEDDDVGVVYMIIKNV